MYLLTRGQKSEKYLKIFLFYYALAQKTTSSAGGIKSL